MSNCQSCKFGIKPEWMNNSAFHETLTECHKRAPVVAVDGEGNDISGWPPVRLDDWCGEFVIAPDAVVLA